MQQERPASGELRLGVLVLAWGMQAIITQSLLLREAMVLMFGSEFAWGIVLFAWLFGVAVGALAGGRLAERPGSNDLRLVAVLVALSLAACAELWLFRGARIWLGVGPGELLPLPKTMLAALVFVSPVGAFVGLAFPIACSVRRSAGSDVSGDNEPADGRIADGDDTLRLGRVYAVESAGSLVGGAVFSFWAVEHLAPVEIALACGAITLAASAVFLAGRKRRSASAFVVAGGAVVALAVAIFGGEELDRRLGDLRWRNFAPGLERRAEVESKHQNLAIGRREEQFTLYTDGQVAADFPDPYTHVPLAHFWLCQHPLPRRVLVLGGGAEGMLAEILRHPVEHVDYIELDPLLIDLLQPFLSEQDRAALHDPRVTVHHEDARYFVKSQVDRFDLVIARSPEPMSALRARLYTEEFFRELRRAMTPQSVLCMTAAAAPGELSPESAEYLASVRATLRTQFPDVIIGWGTPAQVLAATTPGLLSTDPVELSSRYASREVASGFFDPAWFEGATDWLEPDKLERRSAQLDNAPRVQISTDLHPIVYLQRLVLWDKMTGGRSQRVINTIRSIGWPTLIAALVVAGAFTLLAPYVRSRLARGPGAAASAAAPPTQSPELRHGWLARGMVTFSVGSTGFATMALSIIWLFAFQNLYGYVYQRIGWIVALFMAGLVVGCGWIGRRRANVGSAPRTDDRLWQRLILVDVLLGGLALSVPFVLSGLGAMQTDAFTFTLVEWAISLLVFVTGVLGGAAFALAGGLQLKQIGRQGDAAGSVVGADHAGACLGALLCGILLIPVFGTAATALLLAGIKFSSAALLALGRRVSHEA